MKTAVISSLAISSLLFGISAAGATDLTIDAWNQPPDPDPLLVSTYDLAPTSASSNDTGLPTSSVIGGTRRTDLAITGPFDPVNDFEITQVTNGSGVLDQSAIGITGTLTKTTVSWNGGGAGLNTNFSGYDRFKLNVKNFALLDDTDTTNIGTLTLRARNSLTGPYSQFSLTLDQIHSSTPEEFLFSNFSNPSVFNGSIQDIQLEITGLKPGLSFTLDPLVAVARDIKPPTVPDPSLAVSCLVLGGAQLAITGWKKISTHGKKP